MMGLESNFLGDSFFPSGVTLSGVTLSGVIPQLFRRQYFIRKFQGMYRPLSYRNVAPLHDRTQIIIHSSYSVSGSVIPFTLGIKLYVIYRDRVLGNGTTSYVSPQDVPSLRREARLGFHLDPIRLLKGVLNYLAGVYEVERSEGRKPRSLTISSGHGSESQPAFKRELSRARYMVRRRSD